MDFKEPTGTSADGEIPLLDAERFSDLENTAAREGTEPEFDFEQAAIDRIKSRLGRTPSGKILAPDELEDRAIDLYNMSCERILSGQASPEQTEKIAAVFGEKPDALVQRLREEAGADEMAGSPEGRGSIGLLRALGR